MRAMKVFDKKEYYSRLKREIKDLCNHPQISEGSELVDELGDKIKAVKENYR
jgi:hypothetical protein